MNLKTKRIVAISFLVVVVALMAINFWTLKNIQKKEQRRSAEYITVRFNEIIKSYALKQEWISCKEKIAGNDTISNYLIKLPKDLPVPLIIQDISNTLEDSTIKINVTEQGIHGNSILKVSFFNKIKLTAEFVYDKEIKRDADTLSFILSNPGDISQQEFNDLIFSSEAYSFLLVPSPESAQFAKTLKEKKKEFGVFLNDDLSEIKYRLSGDYSKERLEISIKEILASFRFASFYIVDDNSKLFKYPNYGIISSEFSKRNINFTKLSKLYCLNNKKDEAVDEFIQKVSQLTKNEKYAFIVDAKNYLFLMDTIKAMKKQGYRFVLYSSLK